MSAELEKLDQRLGALPDCRAVAAELAAQPEFFSLYRDELPGPKSTKPVLALSRYNGHRNGDEQTDLRVGAMRLLHFSDRAIEQECGVDRRSIPWCLKRLEDRKLIPALKDRLAMITGNLAEQSGMVLRVLLDKAHDECSLELAQMIKAVAATHGITVEKYQLVTGSPTEIIGHTGADGRAQIEDWAKQVGAVVDVVATPVDLGSGANPPVSAGTPPLLAAGHGTDTASRPTPPPTQAPGSQAEPPPDRGGGGLPPADGPETPMG